ncbi:hypothetical protein RHOFW104R8_02185 [Rhodanobacter sp. FW104-R8]|nr:hypothetical protein RHOFW104R8_02185 [Rhodanobacter sp. FW104-R8]KZC29679.1 hypothetical protein RhoFW510R10_04795 [Rhodanobacter sp. FW510-R10]
MLDMICPDGGWIVLDSRVAAAARRGAVPCRIELYAAPRRLLLTSVNQATGVQLASFRREPAG